MTPLAQAFISRRGGTFTGAVCRGTGPSPWKKGNESEETGRMSEPRRREKDVSPRGCWESLRGRLT